MWKYEITLIDETRVNGEGQLGTCIKEIVDFTQKNSTLYKGHILWK